MAAILAFLMSHSAEVLAPEIYIYIYGERGSSLHHSRHFKVTIGSSSKGRF
jgi:hypothetical protein